MHLPGLYLQGQNVVESHPATNFPNAIGNLANAIVNKPCGLQMRSSDFCSEILLLFVQSTQGLSCLLWERVVSQTTAVNVFCQLFPSLVSSPEHLPSFSLPWLYCVQLANPQSDQMSNQPHYSPPQLANFHKYIYVFMDTITAMIFYTWLEVQRSKELVTHERENLSSRCTVIYRSFVHYGPMVPLYKIISGLHSIEICHFTASHMRFDVFHILSGWAWATRYCSWVLSFNFQQNCNMGKNVFCPLW